MEPFVNEESGKTAGIISYFWIVGWLVAYFGFHQGNRSSLGSYQLRQTLLFHIVATAVWIIMNELFTVVWYSGGLGVWLGLRWIVQLGLLVLWIVGMIGAVNGEKKPIPLLGERAQTLFPGI
jgi:uncharacterized membrane protein